ncbi:MAG: hypothetical protein R3C11_00925 [Planctomycetaceae bacterium]
MSDSIVQRVKRIRTKNISFSITPSQAVDDYQWTQVTMNAGCSARWCGARFYQISCGCWWLEPGRQSALSLICNNEVWSSVDGRE